MEDQARYRVWSDGKGNYLDGSKPERPVQYPATPKAQNHKAGEDFDSLLDLVGDLKDQVMDQREELTQLRAEHEAMREHVAHLTEALGSRAPVAIRANVEPFSTQEAA